MPRTLQELQADSETEATIESALAALDEIPPQTEGAAREITKLRDELLQELATIRGQGSLF